MKTLTNSEIEIVSGGTKKPTPTPNPPSKDTLGDYIRDGVDWILDAFEKERQIVTNPPPR